MTASRTPLLAMASMALALASVAPTRAEAQAPGLPLLQGAFPGAGLAAGVNVGRGGGRTAVLGAVGFGPRSGRLHLDLGGGVLTGAEPGYKSTPATYGGRLSVRVASFANERVAVTPFFGFGATRARIANPAEAGPPALLADSGRALTTDVLPLGAALGGRIALGSAGALAVSVAPFYAWYRQTGLATEATRGRVRVAGVLDVAVGDRIGAVLGIEAGQTASEGRPGAAGTLVGGGLSYAFGRR